MAGGVEIKDEDHGYASMVERVFGLAKKDSVVTIGIHSAEGDQPHPTDHEVKEAVTILMVGIFNEFGTDTIPSRSFIRAWFDESEAGLRRDLVVLMRSVIAGTRSADEILELIGQRAVGQIQQKISAGIEPANAPSTIRKKGSSTPLIDQGILRSSVTYEVK